MGDDILFVLSMTMIVSILGLVFFHFPYGRIFLGDGGSLLLGTLISIFIFYVLGDSFTFQKELKINKTFF